MQVFLGSFIIHGMPFLLAFTFHLSLDILIINYKLLNMEFDRSCIYIGANNTCNFMSTSFSGGTRCIFQILEGLHISTAVQCQKTVVNVMANCFIKI